MTKSIIERAETAIEKVHLKYGEISATFCAVVLGAAFAAITLLAFGGWMFASTHQPILWAAPIALAAYLVWSARND